MAAAITVQLVAPAQRASADASVFERSSESKKPRLLYDKTAMVMELIVGAAVSIIVSLLVSGNDDGGLIAIRAVAGFVGIFALRFRLQRRAWGDERQSAAQVARSSLLKRLFRRHLLRF
jgi:hypothetical protein